MNRKRLLYLAAAAAVIAPPAFSSDAKDRSGNGGSESQGAGERHHSSSSDSTSSSSPHSSGSTAVPRSESHSGSDSRSSGSPSGGAHGSSPLTDAQRRHPRAGTGSAYYPYYGYGHSHYPYYGGGFYGYYGYPYYGWGYGYYPYGGLYLNSWWGAPPYYGYGPYVPDAYDGGSVRVLVDQTKARVYVDGYYAGSVDDFDGMFQRLHVSPGQHDITIKLEGFKTHNFNAYIPEQGTLKLRWEMEPGEGHDGTGDPTLAPPKRDTRREHRDESGDDRWTYRDRDREREGAPADREARPAQDVFGALRFDVRPADASVYVDGAFRGTARELRTLELPEGQHRLEIVRPGYRTYDRDVTVERGGSVDVTVELEQ